MTTDVAAKAETIDMSQAAFGEIMGKVIAIAGDRHQ